MAKVNKVLPLSQVASPPSPAVSQVQRVFEALMSSKGHTDFSMNNGRYVSTSLQVRWNYFQIGWSMREVTM